MKALSYLDLAWSTLPVLLAMLVLWARGLGQVGPLALGLTRLTAQLWLLGLVLGWVFRHPSPSTLAAVAGVMLLASAQAVGSGSGPGGWGLRLQALGAIAVGGVISMAVIVGLTLRLRPWYDLRTVVPILGMILGNSVGGVSLAAERLGADLRAERDRVELRLSLGATARRAALPSLRAATRAALTPIVRNMMIVGIVSIPGMTTGQLLAGAGVEVALRYQVLVYLGISGTVALSTLILLRLRLRHYFTADDQLRGERLGGTL